MKDEGEDKMMVAVKHEVSYRYVEMILNGERGLGKNGEMSEVAEAILADLTKLARINKQARKAKQMLIAAVLIAVTIPGPLAFTSIKLKMDGLTLTLNNLGHIIAQKPGSTWLLKRCINVQKLTVGGRVEIENGKDKAFIPNKISKITRTMP